MGTTPTGQSEDSHDNGYNEDEEEFEDDESVSGQCSGNESDSQSQGAVAPSCGAGSEADHVFHELIKRGAVPAIVGKRKRCSNRSGGDSMQGEVEMELYTEEAAKKAQAQANEGKKERARFDVEETLAALKIKKLDPRAVSCFLTGLPYLASEEHVAAHFADVGPNKVQLLRDQGASRPNGTGFVTFTAAEHALRACTFSGSKLQGRWIKVRLCEPRDNGLLKTMDGPGVKPAGCLSAVIKCDASVSEASLWKLFEDCQVSNISCLTDKDTGEFRGTAFMDFDDTAMVDKAVKKSGQSIKGLPILVRYKEELQPKVNRGGVAPHNRAPPVPPPAGTKTTFDDASDSE